MTETAEEGTETSGPSIVKRLVAAVLVIVIAAAGYSVITGEEIDLPEWANIPGVDLPVIGDTDRIDCRLSFADRDAEPILIQIDVVDGNADTYADYQYVWNNGNLVDSTGFERPSDDQFIVPVRDDQEDQFFSISIEPEREERVWCESINIAG